MTPHFRYPTISRRSFLRSLAVAPAAATLARASADGVDTAAEGFIDAHVHVWTKDVDRYPLAEGFNREDMSPPSFTPEQLFAHCRPHGVARVVLIQMSYYGSDNRYMLDCIARHPAAFRGVAIIDGRRPGACDEMRRLAGQGVRGFRLYADKAAAEAWTGSPEMKAMWSCAADHGLAMCLLADPDALPAARRMCERFPKTRVVIDHFARIGMRGPVREEDVENLCRLADFRHTF
ncbi:MAG TPA: amidohydrolase family protein, partial [Planctomycetaceae bacterium]